VLPQHRRSPAEGLAVAAAPDDPDAGE
jgi:hypothetical protein